MQLVITAVKAVIIGVGVVINRDIIGKNIIEYLKGQIISLENSGFFFKIGSYILKTGIDVIQRIGRRVEILNRIGCNIHLLTIIDSSQYNAAICFIKLNVIKFNKRQGVIIFISG